MTPWEGSCISVSLTMAQPVPALQPERAGSYLQWIYTGNAIDYYDEASHHWSRTTDAKGQLTNVVEPNTAATVYGYNSLGDLTSVTQPGVSGETARNRSFSYDSLGRLITASNPETGTICYGVWSDSKCVNGYDANSNLLAKTDARGVVTSYQYDTTNRLTQKSYSDGTSASTTPTTISQAGASRMARR